MPTSFPVILLASLRAVAGMLASRALEHRLPAHPRFAAGIAGGGGGRRSGHVTVDQDSLVEREVA